MAAAEETIVRHNCNWSSESESEEAGWREYHERCSREGDGWSHGFNTSCWSLPPPNSCRRNLPTYCSAGDHDQVVLIHEPQYDVIRYFTLENWAKLGDAISRSLNLKYLELTQCQLSARCITAIFGRQRSYHTCPLQKINLQGNNFGHTGVTALLPFLRARPSLTHLNLSCTHMGNEGLRIIADVMDHVRIEYLHIRDNGFGGEALGTLLMANNAKYLVELSVVENEIGVAGYDAIAHFLQRNDTHLKKVMLNCDDKEYGKTIVRSISNESNLEDLFLWSGTSGHPDDTIISALPAVEKLICNTNSFECFCQSNHKMKWLGFNTDSILKHDSAENVKRALDINARSRFGTSTVKIVRCKLRTFYFQGNYDLQSFLKMDVKLMPQVLELVTRTEVCAGKTMGYLGFGSGTYTNVPADDIGAVYRLVRNCHLPQAYSFCSPSLTKVQPAESATNVDSEMGPKTGAKGDVGSGQQCRMQWSGGKGLPNKRPKKMDR